MSLIAEFKCEVCRKKRTYKVVTAEQCDTARVVCMGCRRKHPDTARSILEREAKWRKVQPMISSGKHDAGEVLYDACKRAVVFLNLFEEVSEQAFGDWSGVRDQLQAAIDKADNG